VSTAAVETLSVIDLLASARAGLVRLDPYAARAAWQAGGLLVDIRPAHQRAEEGEVPGALVVERNVLEWRFDPRSDARLPEASYDLHVIVLCSEGYTSSLAAHALQQVGVRRATDVVGGFQAWVRAGLPTTGGPASAPARLAAVPQQPDRSDEDGVPGLRVDRDSRTVHVRGEEVELTRREFDLLAHLVDQPQRVLTRRHLLDAVWQTVSGPTGGTRTVDVHVHRLRGKLGPAFADALVTVRGVGYRWVPTA
jgi:rhodanese-related sulfurtransferase